VPARHRWADQAAVPLDEALAQEHLLLSMRGHGLRAQLEQEAQTRGITLADTINLRSQQALLNMVACGAGITFVPAMSAVPRPGVAIVAIQPRITRRIGWVVRRGRHLPPAAALLLDLLRTPGAEH
jgi:DNA-binding transcriptional LysR family regulator